MALKDSQKGKVAGALILGAAVGAVLGLLFAPERGCETRRKLFKGAKNLSDTLKGNKSMADMPLEDPEIDRPV